MRSHLRGSIIAILAPLVGLAVSIIIVPSKFLQSNLFLVPGDYHKEWWYWGQISILAGSFVIAAVLMRASRVALELRSRAASDLEAFHNCVIAIMFCMMSQGGKGSFLGLDSTVSRMVDQLETFAAQGHMTYYPARMPSMSAHISRVAQALDAQMVRVLRDGKREVLPLAKMLNSILVALSNEQWYGLLDESDLNGFTARENPEVDHRLKRKDAVLLALGVAASLALSGIAAALGVPLAAAAGVGAAVALIPASLWGSRQLGVGGQALVRTITSGAGPAPEGPSVNAAP
ncbi:hypothetical protein [Kitasatospora arboriphila]|uniref:DUF4239 domain-containing protein n=1 Tax=Kitasatospora arboriphila TaxID=258052 RepID=A0ABN1TLI6_9ACTN